MPQSRSKRRLRPLRGCRLIKRRVLRFIGRLLDGGKRRPRGTSGGFDAGDRPGFVSPLQGLKWIGLVNPGAVSRQGMPWRDSVLECGRPFAAFKGATGLAQSKTWRLAQSPTASRRHSRLPTCATRFMESLQRQEIGGAGRTMNRRYAAGELQQCGFRRFTTAATEAWLWRRSDETPLRRVG